MLPANPIPQVCNYGSSATYCSCPTDEQIAAGVIPLDSLPAAWWNWMWSKTNQAVNCARFTVGTLITELNTVLAQAGVCSCDACTDQLYQAITKLRRIVGDADYPGAVKSSSTPGQVSIDANGVMTANCVGNATQLTTASHTLVGAVNELKTCYDCCISDINSALGGKAPTGHASSNTTYGVGSSSDYGHLKISDQYTSVLEACSGVAASQYALATAYSALANAGYTTLGNTVGCALGTAAAGTATTAAHSDHVHPLPTCVACAGCATCAGANSSGVAFGSAATCEANCFRASTWTPTCVACAGQSYCVMDYCKNTTPLYLGYACAALTCAQIRSLAAYSLTYTSGKTVIKDVDKSTVQSWLGLGSAAYCATSAFRSCTWNPAYAECADKIYDADITNNTRYSIFLGLCACANGYNNAYRTPGFFFIRQNASQSSIGIPGGGYGVRCAEAHAYGKVGCCCSANAENCYCFSCTAFAICPTKDNSVYSDSVTHIATYDFYGAKTTVCALRKCLYGIFGITANTCYQYYSEYYNCIGEAIIGCVCICGKRSPLAGIQFMDRYGGDIMLRDGTSTTGVARLYDICGACLLCDHPGITYLTITTLNT